MTVVDSDSLALTSDITVSAWVYLESWGDDGEGHYVAFDVPAARKQVAEFLIRLAANPVGNVPPP